MKRRKEGKNYYAIDYYKWRQRRNPKRQRQPNNNKTET